MALLLGLSKLGAFVEEDRQARAGSHGQTGGTPCAALRLASGLHSCQTPPPHCFRPRLCSRPRARPGARDPSLRRVHPPHAEAADHLLARARGFSRGAGVHPLSRCPAPLRRPSQSRLLRVRPLADAREAGPITRITADVGARRLLLPAVLLGIGAAHSPRDDPAELDPQGRAAAGARGSAPTIPHYRPSSRVGGESQPLCRRFRQRPRSCPR